MKRAEYSTILVNKLRDLLLQNSLFLSVAESCTGGLLSAYLTSTPGCSMWFERGFVTYSNFAKQEMLEVSETLLDKYGAVSHEVVCAMAKGVLSHSHADISIAISGIAGPDGGSTEKPVGTVWMAFGYKEHILSQKFFFRGNRLKIQEQAVSEALIAARNFVKRYSL
jgi:nicotinamide-nucleotide amidase